MTYQDFSLAFFRWKLPAPCLPLDSPGNFDFIKQNFKKRRFAG